MLRGLVHVLAWALATSAAVTLSWWGVHTVMAGTAYDPPRALPITAGGATAKGTGAPLTSSTERPEASASPRDTPAPSPKPTPPKPAATRPGPSLTATAPSPSAPSSSRVKSYDTAGGRAVFDLGQTSAALVSATPGAGWSMQVFKTETWIRVEFSSGADRVSVFCTWHDGPPRVEIVNY
ncbi:hypothetical protein [Streptomyces sp. NPDC047079]|uniref:hypothetical protein n=1 Tax=Streptomyces sp. NPDC047079 TaxID=3154607 RepID=UPI0033DBD3BF